MCMCMCGWQSVCVTGLWSNKFCICCWFVKPGNICLCICVYVSIYNIHSTYVCFLSWVSSYFVMQKLSLTSIISEMTNYNEVDDSQYNLYICIWLFQMLKIKYLDMKWFQRHQIRTENKMKNYETMNGNFISLAALISWCFDALIFVPLFATFTFPLMSFQLLMYFFSMFSDVLEEFGGSKVVNLMHHCDWCYPLIISFVYTKKMDGIIWAFEETGRLLLLLINLTS